MLPDGSVMVDGDPYIVFNEKMKAFSKAMFDEAESRGHVSKEDKARYLSGRIFEMSPFGTHDGLREKNAIGIFEGLTSNDVEKHHLACVHKSIVQRALLESRGIRTRNSVYKMVPLTYPLKPIKSSSIQRMNDIMHPIGMPFAKVGISFPHFTVDGWFCENEDKKEGCKWETMDATFDDTERMLNIRPEIDKDLVLSEDHPETVEKYWKKYLDLPPIIMSLYKITELPLVKGIVRSLFKKIWFDPLKEGNR